MGVAEVEADSRARTLRRAACLSEVEVAAGAAVSGIKEDAIPPTVDD